MVSFWTLVFLSNFRINCSVFKKMAALKWQPFFYEVILFVFSFWRALEQFLGK